MELPKEKEYSARLAQAEFTSKSAPMATFPSPWAARPQSRAPGNVLRRECKLGELRWLPTVSRPDLCARPARLASKINSLPENDKYRVNDLMQTVQVWRPTAVLKCASSSHPNEPAMNQPAMTHPFRAAPHPAVGLEVHS